MAGLFGSISWGQGLRLAVLCASVVPFGNYMANVYRNKSNLLTPYLGKLEDLLYRGAGINPSNDMDWLSYALSVLAFSAIGFATLYIIVSYQVILPANLTHLPGLPPEKAFLTTVSVVTNTRLSSDYIPDALTPFSRLVGMTVQSFLSCSVGISVFVAIARGMAGGKSGLIGNFWVDLVRTNIYVLLPLSCLFVLLMATSGVSEALQSFAQTHWMSPTGLVPNSDHETLLLIATRAGGIINAASTETAGNTFTVSLITFLSITLIPSSLSFAFTVIMTDRCQPVFSVLASFAGGILVWACRPDAADFLPEKVSLIGGDTEILSGFIAVLILVIAGANWIRRKAPPYLGHRFSPFEILMAATTCLVLCGLVLLEQRLQDKRFVSTLISSSVFYYGLSLIILLGRFWVMIPALAIAGSLSHQRTERFSR